ncbi:hypothetical protein [Rothia sp. HMSC071C12]|uniref:hypothetical protein n=1 Tax=Rothia sp. HMSC071C12 TaxID=1739446 RepID=UPI00114CC49B|nr:hypothetical protein [Rothia sp. HMSC071C12]
MTEELSQDSSRPQETSKDSGVSSEGRLSNPTGENAVLQSSQKSPTVTKQNNQNNKKYDLGVLFVHGIGGQKKGETFKAIYPSIRDEFNSNGLFKYKELSKLSDESVEVTGEISDGNAIKNIIFRESNWNKKYSNPARLKGKRTRLAKVKEWVLNAINCFFLLLYFCGMRIVSSRIHNIIFSLSAVFLFLFLGDKLIFIFSNFQKFTSEDRFALYFSAALLFAPIFLFFTVWSKWDKWFECKKWVLIFAFIFILLVFMMRDMEILWKVIAWVSIVILGIIVSLIILFPFMEWERIKPLVTQMWEQVNDSADYIRTGSEFKYLQAVELGVKDLMKESDRVIVVAHSMGEYLTYKSLKRTVANMDCEEVQLIGVGGGLGLVSLMGSLRASDRKGEYSIAKSIFLSFGAAFQVFIIWGGFTISVLGLVLDLYRSLPLLAGSKTLDSYIELNIRNPYIPFETPSWVFNIIFHGVFFIIFLAAGFFIEKIISIDVIGDSRLKFFKYSHFLDPVGNSAGFYYGNMADKSITPNSSFAHSIRSYFTAGEIGAKSMARHVSKYIYMRRRVVQHILSTAYENPDILQKKTHSLKDVIIEVVSWLIAMLVTVLSGNMDLKLFLAFLPLVAIYNYLILRIFLWIRVVAETTRDSFQNPRNTGRVWDVLFWLVVCILIFFMIDIVVLSAIDTILSVGVK